MPFAEQWHDQIWTTNRTPPVFSDGKALHFRILGQNVKWNLPSRNCCSTWFGKTLGNE